MLIEVKSIPSRGKRMKRILVCKCDFCHSIFEDVYDAGSAKNNHHYCSREHYAEAKRKGGASYNKVTQTCIEKFGVPCSFQSKESIKKIKETMIERFGADHQMRSPEISQKFRKTCSERYPEYDFSARNEAVSKAITKRYLEGGFEWSRGHYTSTKTGSSIFYRSSWELEFAKQLDFDENIKTWEYEFTSLQYEFEGKQHRYIPDFHLEHNDGSHILVEVKPSQLKNSKRNIAKRDAAMKFCSEQGWKYEEKAFETHSDDASA